MTRPTIFALSSGAGRAAVAVIRVSGPATRFVLETLVGDVPPMRRASVRRLIDPASRETLDEALVLFFPGPRSYTGEDTAELQVHGGRAVVQATLQALGALHGCRLAEPGEFTRRAMENGKLDLTRVEGIADLIDAETPQQRRQAYAQISGRLAEQAQAWRAHFLDAMAEVEAEIDFADEGDVGTSLDRSRLQDTLRRLGESLRTALDDSRRGERLRDGFTVVIAGPPNAGKSTLLNALARRDVAIVSDIPGTTRDLVEVHLDLNGVPVILVDTAGLRDSDDPIERMGMDRAARRAEAADLVLWLCPWDSAEKPAAALPFKCVAVTTKIDSAPVGSAHAGFAVSARTGLGIGALLALLTDRAGESLTGEPAIITRERHRTAIAAGLLSVDRASALLSRGSEAEMVAEDLRLGARAMGSILGVVDVEHVLDRLFAQFCIGK